MSDTELLNTPKQDCCPAAQTPADSPDGVASNSQAFMEHNNQIATEAQATATEALQCALALKAIPPLTFEGADDEVITFVPATGVVTVNSPDNTKCYEVDPDTGNLVEFIVDENGNQTPTGNVIDTDNEIGPSLVTGPNYDPQNPNTHPPQMSGDFKKQCVYDPDGNFVGIIDPNGFHPAYEDDHNVSPATAAQEGAHDTHGQPFCEGDLTLTEPGSGLITNLHGLHRGSFDN